MSCSVMIGDAIKLLFRVVIELKCIVSHCIQLLSSTNVLKHCTSSRDYTVACCNLQCYNCCYLTVYYNYSVVIDVISLFAAIIML